MGCERYDVHGGVEEPVGTAPILFGAVKRQIGIAQQHFRRPAIIMLTIPLVIIGAVLGLMVSRAFFSFTAILGIYSLIGIIINNGIVLIDKIDSDRAGGGDRDWELSDGAAPAPAPAASGGAP